MRDKLKNMDPETMCFSTINMNSFSDAPSLQGTLEQPLEKKSGQTGLSVLQGGCPARSLSGVNPVTKSCSPALPNKAAHQQHDTTTITVLQPDCR